MKKLELGSASFYSLMVHEGSKLSKDIEAEESDNGKRIMEKRLSSLTSHFVD